LDINRERERERESSGPLGAMVRAMARETDPLPVPLSTTTEPGLSSRWNVIIAMSVV
jgi:hypothetical protein